MRPLRNYALIAIGTVGLLLLAGISVLLAVSVQPGPDEPPRHTAVDGAESYPMRHAFGNPVVTLFQPVDNETDWNWLYHPDRSACVGRQEIASQQAAGPTSVSGSTIAIGSTGMVQLDLPAGAMVFSSMDVTLGSDTWTIPFTSWTDDNGGSDLAIFYGGIFAEVPGGVIPGFRSATADLEVSPVTAYECYDVVNAVWHEQAVVAVGLAFPEEELKVVITDFPTPAPTHTPHPTSTVIPTIEPDTDWRGLVGVPEARDTDSGEVGGTANANPLTTAGTTPAYDWVTAATFPDVDRFPHLQQHITYPRCLDPGNSAERYIYANRGADGHPTLYYVGAGGLNQANQWIYVKSFYSDGATPTPYPTPTPTPEPDTPPDVTPPTVTPIPTATPDYNAYAWNRLSNCQVYAGQTGEVTP